MHSAVADAKPWPEWLCPSGDLVSPLRPLDDVPFRQADDVPCLSDGSEEKEPAAAAKEETQEEKEKHDDDLERGHLDRASRTSVPFASFGLITPLSGCRHLCLERC